MVSQSSSPLSSQKAQIEAAALAVFSEKGYAGATIAEIAARAGVNPAIIYRYFSGKRELFNALQRPELDFPDAQTQQRRETIIQAAMQVFSQKGYSAATMDDIAEAAGLSKAGIYLYFASKEALFLAALENPAGLQVVEQLLRQHLAEPGSDPEEGLTQVAAGYLTLFERPDTAALLRIILSEGMRNADIATTFSQSVLKRGTAQVVHYLQPFYPLPDLPFRVQALFGMLFAWGMVNRLMAPEADRGNFPALEQVARQMVRQFLFGLEGSKH